MADNEVVLWVVKGKSYAQDDEKQLYASLEKAFDVGMIIKIKYVDAVERTKAGKLRLVVTDNM